MWTRRFETSPEFFNLGGDRSTALDPGTAAPTLPAALRYRHRRRVEPARPEQHRQHRRQRRSAAAGHLRQAAAVRPRRDRARRASSSRATASSSRRRQHRLLQPVAHRAVLRSRGGDARAASGSAVPADHRLERHDVSALQLLAELRSAAARGGHRRRCCFGQAVDLEDAELRALRPSAAQKSEQALLQEAMTPAADRAVHRAGDARVRRSLRRRHVQITPSSSAPRAIR